MGAEQSGDPLPSSDPRPAVGEPEALLVPVLTTLRRPYGRAAKRPAWARMSTPTSRLQAASKAS